MSDKVVELPVGNAKRLRRIVDDPSATTTQKLEALRRLYPHACDKPGDIIEEIDKGFER